MILSSGDSKFSEKLKNIIKIGLSLSLLSPISVLANNSITYNDISHSFQNTQSIVNQMHIVSESKSHGFELFQYKDTIIAFNKGRPTGDHNLKFVNELKDYPVLNKSFISPISDSSKIQALDDSLADKKLILFNYSQDQIEDLNKRFFSKIIDESNIDNKKYYDALKYYVLYHEFSHIQENNEIAKQSKIKDNREIMVLSEAYADISSVQHISKQFNFNKDEFYQFMNIVKEFRVMAFDNPTDDDLKKLKHITNEHNNFHLIAGFQELIKRDSNLALNLDSQQLIDFLIKYDTLSKKIKYNQDEEVLNKTGQKIYTHISFLTNDKINTLLNDINEVQKMDIEDKNDIIKDIINKNLSSLAINENTIDNISSAAKKEILDREQLNQIIKNGITENISNSPDIFLTQYKSLIDEYFKATISQESYISPEIDLYISSIVKTEPTIIVQNQTKNLKQSL